MVVFVEGGNWGRIGQGVVELYDWGRERGKGLMGRDGGFKLGIGGGSITW